MLAKSTKIIYHISTWNNLGAFLIRKKEENMFIWDWIAIAFGWLLFLLLILVIVSLINGMINGVKKGLRK